MTERNTKTAGKIIDLMSELKASLSVNDLCDRCGKEKWQHTGLEKFCPFISTFRTAPVPPSSSIAASETATTARPCTCHPADNPPRPCAEKYALSDCRPSADPSVTTDAETVNLPGWCLYCGGTYRTFAPGLAGCDNRECVRHPYINEANAAKKAAAWRGTPESSPAVPLCSQCGKHDARFACPDFLSSPAVDAGTTPQQKYEALLAKKEAWFADAATSDLALHAATDNGALADALGEIRHFAPAAMHWALNLAMHRLESVKPEATNA